MTKFINVSNRIIIVGFNLWKWNIFKRFIFKMIYVLLEIIYNYLKKKNFVNVKDLKKVYDFTIINSQIEIYFNNIILTNGSGIFTEVEKRKKRF